MEKDFDRWNAKKKALDCGIFSGHVHEREIWWCSLGANVGDEQDGKNDNFSRPVLIIKKFNNRIVLAVPLTTKEKENPYYFSFVSGGIRSVAIISQLRLLSTSRFYKRIQRIDQKILKEIRMEIIRKILS